MYDESETRPVGGDNAEFRHYPARPTRRSRCIHALGRATDLFVRRYNARQLKKRKYPRHPRPIGAMISTLPGKKIC